MSEEAQPAAEPTRTELIEQAWNHASAEPVEGEAGFDSEPAAEPPITPKSLDEKPPETRESVAPSIREFIRAQKPAEPAPTSALEQEIAELRGALNSLANRGKEEAGPTNEQLMLQKLEALEERELAAAQANATAAAEEAYNQRIAALRTGAIENINARASDFPGLIALEQQETVVNALFQRSDEGQETSEDEVASEVEEGLREVYQKLHAVYGSTQSQAPQPASERQQTLQPALAGTDDEPDLSNMSRREKIDYLWSKNQ